MNNINTIYTTVSHGQTHIAADAKYIGRVDSYNNFFTQFFSWLFNLSMAVDFDGKTRIVNKKSYKNLVRNLTQNDAIDQARLRMFREVAENAHLPAHNLRMRDAIAFSDRKALFEKLARAISQGDTDKALLMIGKGAEINAVYYDRKNFGLAFNSIKDGLSDEEEYAFDVYKGTPLLQAAFKGNKAVVECLKKFGAEIHAKGETYTYRRTFCFRRNPLRLKLHYRREKNPLKAYWIDSEKIKLINHKTYNLKDLI